MPNIPADVVGQAASTAATATQNAATLTQTPKAHWTDVWTQTGEGLLSPPAVSPFMPPPGQPITAEAVKRAAEAMVVANKVERTDWGELKEGMSQQAGVVADQASQLWDGKLPDGTPMSTLQRVGAAFGLLSSIEQLITMPFGAIPFPAFPAVRITDMDVGLPHAHMHPPNLIPPAPPVPLPSTGPIIPIPFLSGASKTLINNMPAARCGDMGLGIWCGGYFPMYEVFLGSANVWIEGNRAGRVGIDITKHCIFSAPKPSDPPVGPMFGATVTCSPNVMIGGVPLPSLTSMGIGAAFKAAFKGVGKLIGAARKRFGKAAAAADNAPRGPGGSSAVPSTLPPPHATFPLVNSPLVAVASRDIPVGGRHVISEVNVGELAALGRVTGDEWAVVVQADGRRVLLRGDATGRDFNFQDGDQFLVHSHPPGSPAYPSTPATSMNPNGSDTACAEFSQKNYGWDHPQAVVDTNGNVTYYNQHGPVQNPNKEYLPIDNDGNINGIHHRGGNPDVGMSAIPPGMDTPGNPYRP